MAHKRLSSSQTKSWKTCAGSVPLKEMMREITQEVEESGYYAQMGTCAHYLIEICLANGEHPDQYQGRVIEIVNPNQADEDTVLLPAKAKQKDGNTYFEVDQDMVEATTKMTDYVRRRLEEVFPGVYKASRPKDTVHAIKNKHLVLEGHTNPLPHRDDTGGTADVTIDNWPTFLEIVDYKNGSGVFVPVTKNDQVLNYATGRLAEQDFSHDQVRYTICQPRHIQAPEDGIMYEEATREEILDWQKDLWQAADRVDEADKIVEDVMSNSKSKKPNTQIFQEASKALFQQGYLSTGTDGSACTWCPLVTLCPAARARVEELVEMDFADDPHELEPASGINHLSVLLPWVPYLDKFIKETVANAERYALSGGKIEGFKIVRGKSNRTWKEATQEALIKELTGKWKIPKEKLFSEPKFISGPAAEKLLPAKERKKFSEAMMIKPEGSLTLVPESDPKPEVDVNPANDFDDSPDVPE